MITKFVEFGVDLEFLYCTLHPTDQFQACEQLNVNPYNVLPPKEDQLFSDAVYLTRLFILRNREHPCREACACRNGARASSDSPIRRAD
jgi:hypothetical protein